MAPLPTLPHNTISRNSRWRSSKPKVPIFQLVEELTTRFQIIIPCFRGRTIQWRHLHASMCTSGDMSTSGLAATILDLSLPVRSDSIVGISVGLLEPENIGLAVGIALLSCVQVDIWVLPATILDLSLPVSSDSIVCIAVGLLDPENIGLAVGIALLLCVQLEFPHEEVVTLFTNKNCTPSRLFTCSSGRVLIKRIWIITWTQRLSKPQIIVNNVSKNRLSICFASLQKFDKIGAGGKIPPLLPV